MLQALLEERFRLKTHRETREMPMYGMMVGKSGLKLQPLGEGECTPVDFVHTPAPPKLGKLPNICVVMLIRPTGAGDIRIDARGSTMTQFAQRLPQLAGRTVVDETGISGKFNFHLQLTPDPAIPGQNFPGDRRGDMGTQPIPATLHRHLNPGQTCSSPWKDKLD
jgi:bla regulator protein blaR1